MTVKPGRKTFGVQVPFLVARNERVSVVAPETWLSANDGTLRSLAASAGTPVSRPWPAMKPRQSRVEAVTKRPGSKKAFGST